MSPIYSVIAETAAWAARNRDVEGLRKALADHGCYIYGAGGFGREVARVARAKGYRLHGFIDGFACDAEVAGAPCQRPEAVDSAAAARGVLILAVNNFKTPVADIVEWAGRLPFVDVLYVAELPDVLDSALGTYWQGSRSLVAESSEELSALSSMLGDERSREILAALARYRITGRPEDHPPVDRGHQYFPCDLPISQTTLNVVDCGAFPGDMLDVIATAGHELGNWYAFEPDPANFQHLRKVAAERGGFSSASLYPCGVGDSSLLVRFSGGAADASRAIDQGAVNSDSVMVQIVRVDDVIQAERIDMIKLDVEGFEAQALDGMLELLTRHRPRLAVAVYHRPADLWEIPFKLARHFPGARYALRQHGYNGYDTVLYVDL